jgi:AraC-like DNA-binding protein
MAQMGTDQRRAATSLTITVNEIIPLRTLAANAGVSFDAILVDLGLSPGLASGSDTSPVALVDYFRILERLSFATHDETCKLSTRTLLPGTTRFVLSNLSDCDDLAAAMKLIAQSYNILHGGVYNHVEMRGDFLAYVVDDSNFPYSFARDDDAYAFFTMECVLIFLHSMLSHIAQTDLSAYLKKVCSRRPRRGPRGNHLDFWGVPVRLQSSTYALVYDLDAASLPIIGGEDVEPFSRTLYREVIERIEQGRGNRDLIERVRELISQGVQDQTQVARRLFLSTATLRRRLHERGTSFGGLRQQVLNDSAKSLLIEHHHIGEIAETLGFSDIRSFNRAFKDWNGVTPRSYRDALGITAGTGTDE